MIIGLGFSVILVLFFFVFCVILRGFGLFCGVRVRIGVLRFRNEVQGILV